MFKGVTYMPKSTSELDTQMQTFAESAVKMAAEEYGVTLDYSKESIKLLDEKILEKEHQASKKGTLLPMKKTALCLYFGAYVGETFKKVYNHGEWVESPDDETKLKVTIAKANDTAGIGFISKVQKRIENGDEDDVNGLFLYVAMLVPEE